MIRELWFKNRFKRTDTISAGIREDLKWFLELNYIPDETARESTASLYDASDLSQAMECRTDYELSADEEVTDNLGSMPVEFDDHPLRRYYSSGDTDGYNPDATLGINESEYEIAGKAVKEFQSIPDYSQSYEFPEAIECNNKRRVLPSLPQMRREKKEGISQPSKLQRQGLEAVISSLGQTFQQKLFGLIDKKGYTDSQVYRKANLDRKLFSKIRCNEYYKPSKLTALSLAVALELNLDETTDLLGRAGLALSPSDLTDMIVKYCITHQIYDIYDVNALLYEYDQQLLGC